MGDIADILGVQKKETKGSGIPSTVNPSSSATPASASQNQKQKKPLGMSREVYALMGEQGLPPVMPSQSAAGGFKKKRNGATGQARWEWRSFTNSARNDPSWGVLKLKHWQPASAEQQDYAFALLNKKVSVPTYTPAEYDTHLQVAGWSAMETDHLFDLARRLDLRWPIVADRYELMPQRSIAELQHRYYDVVARLHDAKRHDPSLAFATEGAASANTDGDSFKFNLEYETKRRAQRDAEWTRSAEDEHEERELRVQLRKVGAVLKRRQKAAVASSSSSSNKRRADAGTGHTGASAPVVAVAPDAAAEAASTGTLVSIQPRQRGSGVYLRSSRHRLPSQPDGLSARMMQKMALVVMELGVPPRPLPTERVCDAYDALRQDIIQLLSLQKV